VGTPGILGFESTEFNDHPAGLQALDVSQMSLGHVGMGGFQVLCQSLEIVDLLNKLSVVPDGMEKRAT
jgi:hypothetical protein